MIISQLFLSIANALYDSLALMFSIKNFGVYLISLLSDLCSPVATGGFRGLIPQTKLQAPQIELLSTINRWSFCEISECQAP